VIKTVSIDLVVPPTYRVRQTTPKRVVRLAESIREIGLLNPITVRPLTLYPEGTANPVQGYCIVAGIHRFEACQSLNHTEIVVNIVDLDDLHRQLVECDENLCGTNLSVSERAIFTARRKQVYEQLHPETRLGATGHGRGKVRQLGEPISERFTADTAAATGKSERVVQRDASRGEKIDEEVLGEISGTDLDRGVVLDALTQYPKDEQKAALAEIEAELKQPKPQLSDEEIAKREGAEIFKVWNKKSPAGRADFMDLAGLVYTVPRFSGELPD
jgi:ParB family chromosome partitioning protein